MKRRGFTLVELMIVLADYRVKMEQCLQDNRNCGSASGNCPVVVADSKYFSYSIDQASTQSTLKFNGPSYSAGIPFLQHW